MVAARRRRIAPRKDGARVDGVSRWNSYCLYTKHNHDRALSTVCIRGMDLPSSSLKELKSIEKLLNKLISANNNCQFYLL